MTDFADSPVTLACGTRGEPLSIQTGNPSSYHQVISAPETITPIHIGAQFFNADSDSMVIVVPGSLGVAPSHLDHASTLCELGISTLVIDPFGSRQVTSTVANQAQYSFAASSYDVLAAAKHLHEETNVKKVGAQGHSRGGTAVLNAAVKQFGTSSTFPSLSAVYAAYPWCGFQFQHPDIGETAVRSIIGDQDEWCLPQQVQSYMHAMTLLGGSASTKIVEGAHHSFDRNTPVELIKDASVAPSAPTTYLTNEGQYVHPLTGVCPVDTKERELMLYGVSSGYGVRGARIGSSGDQAAAFKSDMTTFWQEWRDAE